MCCFKMYHENICYKNVNCINIIIVQRDATQSSLFSILGVHSTCFGCQLHPSSGVHKTVTTASGTGAATSLHHGQAWPRWREVAAQTNMTSTGGCNYSFVFGHVGGR